MAYRIEYAKNTKYQPPESLRWDKTVRLIAVFFLLFLLFTTLFWPQGKLMLQKMILPCDVDVTSQAFTLMLEQIRGGEGVHEAVEAFCREILSTVELSG